MCGVRKCDNFVLVNWSLNKAWEAAGDLKCFLFPHISLDNSARHCGHWVALLCDENSVRLGAGLPMGNSPVYDFLFLD